MTRPWFIGVARPDLAWEAGEKRVFDPDRTELSNVNVKACAIFHWSLDDVQITKASELLDSGTLVSGEYKTWGEFLGTHGLTLEAK